MVGSVLISETFVNVVLFFLGGYLFLDGLQPSHIDGKQIEVFTQWKDECVFSKSSPIAAAVSEWPSTTTTIHNPINAVSYSWEPVVRVKITSQRRINREKNSEIVHTSHEVYDLLFCSELIQCDVIDAAKKKKKKKVLEHFEPMNAVAFIELPMDNHTFKHLYERPRA